MGSSPFAIGMHDIKHIRFRKDEATKKALKTVLIVPATVIATTPKILNKCVLFNSR